MELKFCLSPSYCSEQRILRPRWSLPEKHKDFFDTMMLTYEYHGDDGGVVDDDNDDGHLRLLQ